MCPTDYDALYAPLVTKGEAVALALVAITLVFTLFMAAAPV